MAISMLQLSLESNNTTLTTYKYEFMTGKKCMLIVTSSLCELHRQYGFNKLTDGGEVVSTTPTVTTSTPVTTGTMTETHIADISAPSE